MNSLFKGYKKSHESKMCVTGDSRENKASEVNVNAGARE